MRHDPRTPAQPTRERALYVAAARTYTHAFRMTFVDPERARRRFRLGVECRGQGETLKRLVLYPEDFGTRCARRFGSDAADPAFIYWTYRDRRPRALMRRIAWEIKAEAARRDHADRLKAAREDAHRRAVDVQNLRETRERYRKTVRELVDRAAKVYAAPASACRVLLRVARKHGVRRARVLVEHRPEAIGALRVVKHKRGFAFLFLVFDSQEEAKAAVPDFLETAFDAAARSWRNRVRPGALHRPAARAAAARAFAAELVDATPRAGTLDDAARLTAILCRRRDVDVQPVGAGPPTIQKQLSAMLPDHMAGLIVEVLKLSAKKSGEDPEWSREADFGRELSRSLEQELKPARGWSRGREMDR